MVDGVATFGEISKRAAPSMRASLGDLFRELETSGYIQEKNIHGKSSTKTIPENMVVPTKISTPHNKQLVKKEAGELDFMQEFDSSAKERSADEIAKTEKLKAEALEKDKQEIEAEKKRAQKEAEAIVLKAEQEAARIREETARRARQEAESMRLKAELEAKKVRAELEAARLKAEQEVKKVRDELEAARLKAAQEAKLRLEAAAREKQQAEAARLLAEQEASKVRDELEAARLKAEQEAKLRLEAAAREQQQAAAARLLREQEAKKIRDEFEAIRLKAEQEAQQRRELVAREQQQAETARLLAEQEAQKAREVLETARLKVEQETRLRLEAEAAELNAKQELEASQLRETAAAKIEQSSPEVTESKQTNPFTFGSFDVDQPQSLADPADDGPPDQEVNDAQQANSSTSTTQAEEEHKSSTSDARKPSQERIGREEPEHHDNEILAREQAAAQARVWAEAEQRALDIAASNAERAALQIEYTFADAGNSVKPPPTVRVYRKPIEWGKLVGFVSWLGVFLLVLLIGVLFVVPYTLPMRDYMPKVEQQLSASMHQPVHIGYMSARILPTPRLELGEIYIGRVKEFQAGTAKINFDLAGLFSDNKPIGSIEFEHVKVSGPGLQNVAAWLQQLARNDQYPVSRMLISQGTLDADAFELTGIEGEFNFSPDGKFSQANLHTISEKLKFGINVTPDNKLAVAVSVRDTALPLLPNWLFDELNAKGVLSNDELQISDFNARMLGGVVQGNAGINWRSGWRAQGELSAKTITMQKFSKLLNGNVDGTARFKMTSKDLTGLTDSAVLDGNFTANDGVIGGMDIVETARMRSKENLPGGRTHFDSVSGVISYFDNVYHFKQVKVKAGVLDATAAFDVDKQQLAGRMNVSLTMHEGTSPVDLQMGGLIDNPTLRLSP